MRKIDAQLKYERQLVRIYRGLINLAQDAKFVDYETPIEHTCYLCGETTRVKPMTMLALRKTKSKSTGQLIYKRTDDIPRGCTVCKSTAQNCAELTDYSAELYRVHGGKYSLAYLPQKFRINSGKYKEVFTCNECKSQMYRTPQAVIDPKFQCPRCEVRNRRTQNAVFYEKRLLKLYGVDKYGMGKIQTRNAFQDGATMMHSCDAGHRWLATPEQMLNGFGCLDCNSQVQVKKVEPVAYRNKIFHLRTELEIKGMGEMILLLDHKTKNLRTSRDFPTPILFGKNAVAFYDTAKKIVADVMSEKKFKANMRRKIPRSIEEAKKLGLSYGVIIVTPKRIVSEWDEKRLTGKTKHSKKKIDEAVGDEF